MGCREAGDPESGALDGVGKYGGFFEEAVDEFADKGLVGAADQASGGRGEKVDDNAACWGIANDWLGGGLALEDEGAAGDGVDDFVAAKRKNHGVGVSTKRNTAKVISAVGVGEVFD